jgi:hypothetical protein
MFWDIALSSLILLDTAATGFLGFYVTLHPPAPNTPQVRTYKIRFAAVVGFGLLLIVTQGIRNGLAQNAFNSQLSEMKERLSDMRGRMNVLLDLTLHPPINPEIHHVYEAVDEIEGTLKRNGPTKVAEPVRPAITKSPPPSAPAVSVVDSTRLMTNQELRKHVISLANAMRDFEHNYRLQEEQEEQDQNNKKPVGNETQEQVWRRQISASMKSRSDYENEFRKQYLGEASAYRDELLRRLNITPPKEEEMLPALRGAIAGPDPLSDLGTYLERLARQLPD